MAVAKTVNADRAEVILKGKLALVRFVRASSDDAPRRWITPLILEDGEVPGCRGEAC